MRVLLSDRRRGVGAVGGYEREKTKRPLYDYTMDARDDLQLETEGTESTPRFCAYVNPISIYCIHTTACRQILQSIQAR